MKTRRTCRLRQEVQEATLAGGHTLDVIIIRETSNIISSVSVSDTSLVNVQGKTIKDLYEVSCITSITKPQHKRETVTYRELRAIDITQFKSDIRNSEVLHLAIPVQQNFCRYAIMVLGNLWNHMPYC